MSTWNFWISVSTAEECTHPTWTNTTVNVDIRLTLRIFTYWYVSCCIILPYFAQELPYKNFDFDLNKNDLILKKTCCILYTVTHFHIFSLTSISIIVSPMFDETFSSYSTRAPSDVPVRSWTSVTRRWMRCAWKNCWRKAWARVRWKRSWVGKELGGKKYETSGLSMIKWIVVEVEGKLMCLEMFRIYFL